MPLDYFGVPLNKRRLTEPNTISEKQAQDVLTAHKLLNLNALKKIDKIELDHLEKLFRLDTNKIEQILKFDEKTAWEKFKPEFKANLKKFLKHNDVKDLMTDGVTTEKSCEKLTKGLENCFKAKNYLLLTKDTLQELIFDSKNTYKNFDEKFNEYRIKKPEIKDQIIVKDNIREIIFDSSDNYKTFNEKFKDYVEKNPDIKNFIAVQVTEILRKGELARVNSIITSLKNYDTRIRTLEIIQNISEPEDDLN